MLSSSTQSTLETDSLFQGMGVYTSLSRALFELCSDLFCSPLEPAEKALSDAKPTKAHLNPRGRPCGWFYLYL